MSVKFYKSENQVPLEMHKVRVIQKLNLLPVDERLRAIQKAGNNTFLLQNKDIYLDMLTTLAVGSHVTLLCKMPSPKILLKALADVTPNLIICVPLILEKIYKNQILPMISKGAMRWTLAVPFLDQIIYTKIRKRLIDAFGGEFEQVIVGGAPLNREVEEFLHKIKFPFTVGYGMTECGPLISYTHWKDFQPSSSGQTLPGIMESKIDSPDPENIPGEICVRGENVMQGYYKNPEATEAVLDSEGWLHTGDMGYVTDEHPGYLWVVGRFKSLLISADGEKYSPEGFEDSLTDGSKYIEQVILHNNQDPYTMVLIVPNKEALKEHAKALGLDANTDEGKRAMLQKIQDEVNEYRHGKYAGMFPEQWLPKAIAVLSEPFTEQNHMVNSTMKIVRGKVEEYYADRIEYAYTQEGKELMNPRNMEAL
mgnify:CR=1 FL=1